MIILMIGDIPNIEIQKNEKKIHFAKGALPFGMMNGTMVGIMQKLIVLASLFRQANGGAKPPEVVENLTKMRH